MAIPELTVVLLLGVPLVAVSYADKVRALREAIEQARLRANLADEKFCAATVEVDPSQWTRLRALLGILGRLVGMPSAFWREFLPALGQVVGLRVVVVGDATEDDETRLDRIVRHAVKAALDERSTRCDSGHSSAA